MNINNKVYKILPVLMCVLLLPGCISSSNYGVQDSQAEEQITRINRFSTLRDTGDYINLERGLLQTLTIFSDDSYAKPRLLFQLADIYSYQLLDIEKAIEYDENLLNQLILDDDVLGVFSPQHGVANGVVLGDQGYVNQFVTIKKSKMIEVAKKRLINNKRLIKGKETSSKKYSAGLLVSHIKSVKKDFATANIK